ncbi:MAG: hypothetical protein HYS06_10705 [Methylocystis sp.]|nr:hypothetical protein [Methylocystis sp.]
MQSFTELPRKGSKFNNQPHGSAPSDSTAGFLSTVVLWLSIMNASRQTGHQTLGREQSIHATVPLYLPRLGKKITPSRRRQKYFCANE